jgi:hypothetical protein
MASLPTFIARLPSLTGSTGHFRFAFVDSSLPVIKQNLLASLTDFRAILLEAGENRQVPF